jgi:hypothetical protein
MDTGRVTALGQGLRIESIFRYLYRRFVRPAVAMTSHLFESLDYLYVRAPDFEAAVRFYTATIGGELRWRIHDGGVWWRRCDSPPPDHLCCWRVISSRITRC